MRKIFLTMLGVAFGCAAFGQKTRSASCGPGSAPGLSSPSAGGSSPSASQSLPTVCALSAESRPPSYIESADCLHPTWRAKALWLRCRLCRAARIWLPRDFMGP